MSTCDYCGGENDEKAQFCQSCGTDLHPSLPPSVPPHRASRVSWRKSLFAAFIVSIVSYPILVCLDYHRIRAYYETQHPGESMGPDFGFGPSFAWIQAAGQSALAFLIVLIIGTFAFKKREVSKSEVV